MLTYILLFFAFVAGVRRDPWPAAFIPACILTAAGILWMQGRGDAPTGAYAVAASYAVGLCFMAYGAGRLARAIHTRVTSGS